jgi:putative ABC transport system permease protein
MLSMYNAIIERTREIGILKSLGATKGFIITEIVKEAIVIVIIGIACGYLLSLVAMAIVLNMFPLLQVEISLDWMINSALIAVIATMLGTIYPAWRASRLDPVEALIWE